MTSICVPCTFHSANKCRFFQIMQGFMLVCAVYIALMSFFYLKLTICFIVFVKFTYRSETFMNFSNWKSLYKCLRRNGC